MAKRKRVEIAFNGPAASRTAPAKKAKPAAKASSSSTNAHPKPTSESDPFTLHVVTGSYDRVLHGILATVTPGKDDGGAGGVKFADSFLFNAHPSAIRSLALSPPSAPAPGLEQKVLLASGSTDPKINIYSLSAHAPGRNRVKDDGLSAAALRPILENSQNRELGLYNPHESSVTKLVFPTRSKLISSSEDSTIAVAKTRNWEQMSTIKAPIPKPQGRPSGDTAPLGETPAGVNDFAVHPSMKLLLSVSKGERCMRLWNLLTGKKAAVLNFSKDMLQEVGEGRHSSGEGRKVVWGTAADSEEFAVGFDRNIVVFGMDSLPRCRVMPDARTKIHRFEYLTVDDASQSTVIAVSTEDGRVMFFSTREEDMAEPESSDSQPWKLKVSKLVGQFGGKEAGVSGRIKDFTIVAREEGSQRVFYVVGGSSDGTVRLWRVAAKELETGREKKKADKKEKEARKVGNLLGSYTTNNRITCTAAFVMIPRPEGVGESEDDLDEDEDEENVSSEEDE